MNTVPLVGRSTKIIVPIAQITFIINLYFCVTNETLVELIKQIIVGQ